MTREVSNAEPGLKDPTLRPISLYAQSCRLPLGWTLRSPVPYGLRFRRPATASELTHYREASGNGFAPSINGTVKHENHQDHNAGSTADTIVMLALRNYQVGARLLVTYMHNLQTIAVSSLLAALDNLVAEHNAPWSEAECWSLDPHDEKDGQLIERWRGMDDRKTEVMIRQGLLSHVPWYRWYEEKKPRREPRQSTTGSAGERAGGQEV